MCACVFFLSWGQFWESNKCPIFKMSILFVLFFCVLDSPATKHQIARAFLCQTIYPFRWIWIWRTKSCAVKKQFVLQKLSCSSKRQTQNFKFHQKELNCRTIKRLNGGKKFNWLSNANSEYFYCCCCELSQFKLQFWRQRISIWSNIFSQVIRIDSEFEQFNTNKNNYWKCMDVKLPYWCW